MTDVIDETTDGMYRAIIENDIWAERPDHQAQGYVFGVNTSYNAIHSGHMVETLHGDQEEGYQYGTDADDMRDYIARQLDRGNGLDWERLERKLAKRYGVVSVERYDRRDSGAFLAVVTGDMCDVWGIPAGASIRAESANVSDWEAWDEGDVWYVEIQQSREDCLIDRGRITGDITCAACGRNCECLMCQRGAEEQRWETIDVSDGFYGREYAAESAREHLSYHGQKVAS